ncbi:MAG: LPXTG cell wall anchor domain-containing protein, partial [Ruminiclostridium sp.]|nr:LPXTG cell wall anchor domain-containing protein [Ruminiclostridium sp.]
ATTQATTQITEETIPQGGETTAETTIEIPDPEVPAAPAELPKTGGIPAGIFYGAGLALSSAGLLIRRFRKSN